MRTNIIAEISRSAAAVPSQVYQCAKSMFGVRQPPGSISLTWSLESFLSFLQLKSLPGNNKSYLISCT